MMRASPLLGAFVILAASIPQTRADEAISESDAMQKIELLGGTVRRSLDLSEQSVVGVRFLYRPDLSQNVYAHIKFNEKYLHILKSFPQLTALDLNHTVVTDAGMQEIKGLTSLTTLGLEGTDVTDEGLRDLVDLKQLINLHIDKTKLSDAGLKDIGRLTRLVKLTMQDTNVTDAGLKDLSPLTNLKYLDVRGTAVTERGRTLLHEAIPALTIRFDTPTIRLLTD